jgi:hypothetical protein
MFKKFVGVIFVSQPSASWVVETASQLKANIAKSYLEGGEKALMVHGGDNKAGRFLEVSIIAKGGCEGDIWLPEGHGGQEWHRFTSELRRLLPPPEGKVGSLAFDVPGK